MELSPSMKMSELLDGAPSLIGVFTRMGFSFGYGDASVADVCRASGVDPDTFLLICRVYSQDGYRPSAEDIDKADLSVIVDYLSRSHAHYLEVDLKDLEIGLERMTESCGQEPRQLIREFFQHFKTELTKHFNFEEKYVFPYVGSPDGVLSEEDHSGVEETLEDLKSLVMIHLPSNASQQEAYKVLSVINGLQDDIHKHILLEETALEGRIQEQDAGSALTSREKEILVCVAKGMINKEIADALNISIHTVITHRKNITAKTGVKTVAGLTVYALLNHLIDLDTVENN